MKPIKDLVLLKNEHNISCWTVLSIKKSYIACKRILNF